MMMTSFMMMTNFMMIIENGNQVEATLFDHYPL